jgi:hypothetical protein
METAKTAPDIERYMNPPEESLKGKATSTGGTPGTVIKIEDWRASVKAYLVDRMSADNVASLIGVHRNILVKRFKFAGITVKKRGANEPKAKMSGVQIVHAHPDRFADSLRAFTPTEVQTMIRLYFEERLTLPEIVVRMSLKCAAARVARTLKRSGLTLRRGPRTNSPTDAAITHKVLSFTPARKAKVATAQPVPLLAELGGAAPSFIEVLAHVERTIKQLATPSEQRDAARLVANTFKAFA